MKEKVSTFASRLQEGLLLRNMKPAELSRRTGLDKSCISRYLKHEYNGKTDAIYKIAQVLDVAEAWLMGYDVPMEPQRQNETSIRVQSLPSGALPVRPGPMIPILGEVRCGCPMYAEENISGYVAYQGNSGETYFALRVVGDSMNAAGINDGDIVIVRQQKTVDPNTIAVICVNGDEATLKRFRQDGNMVFLYPQSYNPSHQVQVYDLSQTPVQIMGRVMEVRKTF